MEGCALSSTTEKSPLVFGSMAPEFVCDPTLHDPTLHDPKQVIIFHLLCSLAFSSENEDTNTDLRVVIPLNNIL